MDERFLNALAARSRTLTGNGSLRTAVDHHEFAPASRQLMASYAQMTRRGMAPGAIAIAMLGATINLFDAFDMAEQLPELLRATADLLEYPGQPS